MRTSTDTGDTTAGPTTRQDVYGLGFVALFLAAIVAVPVWLLAPTATCGCTTPSDLTVYNADTRAVTVRWQQPGILGTSLLGRSGSQELAACTSGDLILAVGKDTATITSSSGSAELAVEVPSGHGGYPIPVVVVRAGGAIERLDAPLPEAEIPMDGSCGS